MEFKSTPMLRGLTLPASWFELLQPLRPVFRRSSTFGLFVLLATGLVARTTRRTVVGMLAGAGMAAVVSFHSACRFFSEYAWDIDRLGLAVGRLIVDRLLHADAPVQAVVDDTLLRRWGKRVHHAFWTHDGSAQGPAKLGRGNRWVIVGIVVRLPFCSHPMCLPILFRLWAGKGTASPVELAGDMLIVLTKAFPHKGIHVVGDAAYHGTQLLVPGTTITTRLPANAALYAPTPPRTGRRGRPAKKGWRLPRLAELAATATWRTVTVNRYGRIDTVAVAVIDGLWYGAFADTPGRAVLVRDTDTTTGYDLALFTTDTGGLTDRRPVRRSLVDRSRQRDRQTGPRHRAGPQPSGPRGRTHRPVRVPRPDPGDRLVRHLWLPPRRPAGPPLRRTLVQRQDRNRIRGHARQAPPRPDRRSIFWHHTKSTRPQHCQLEPT